ncbi:MAG: hypothetical protein ACJ0G1_00020 [Gammaproteobacteria bacterium]
MRKDNLLFGIYVFVILSDWIGTYIPMPLGIRHLVLLLIPIILMSSTKVEKRTLYYFSFLSLLAFISFTNDNVELFNFSVGYFFTFFFFFIQIIFFNIRIPDYQLIRLLKLIVYSNLLFALPTLIGATTDLDIRNHPGVFREVGAFATTMMCSQIICLLLYRLNNNPRYFRLACLFSTICLLTILKKSMFLSLFIWVIYAAFFMNWKKWFFNYKVWALATVIIAIMAAPLKTNIDKNLAYLSAVGADAHVRIGMYVASAKISNEYAPFGSGLGSFGSFASIINNPITDGYFDYRFNDLYYRYEIDDLAGNSEERSREGGNTMLDTYWPHILGELGIFGLLIIFWFWTGKVLYFFRRKDCLGYVTGGFAFYICAVYVSLMGEGLALIQPELPFFVFFHAGLTGIFLRKIQEEKFLIH